MRRNSKKSQKNAFQKYLKTMTQSRLLTLPIIASEGYIRLLDDTATTGMYLVFNGQFNQTHYSKSYTTAERFFRRQVDLAD